MTTFRQLKKYIEDLEVGLALRMDDLGASIKTVENDIATIRSQLCGPSDTDPEVVAERLNLTPARSRIAAALAGGKTVHDMASETGPTEGTVR